MSMYRLLVIEDNSSIAKLVQYIATEAGFDARATCDSVNVLSLYDEFQPHVIVLDILMPDMDGFEVLRFLHQRHSKSHVIILSGDAEYRPMAERIAGVLNITIVGNLAKPFRARELISLLETIKFSLSNPDVGKAGTAQVG